MKLEKLNVEKIRLEKARMSQVKGGTSTTGYVVVGVAENEYPLKDDGTIDWDAEPIIVEFPDENNKKI